MNFELTKQTNSGGGVYNTQHNTTNSIFDSNQSPNLNRKLDIKLKNEVGEEIFHHTSPVVTNNYPYHYDEVVEERFDYSYNTHIIQNSHEINAHEYYEYFKENWRLTNLDLEVRDGFRDYFFLVK
eukprot:TRINITY_DN5854_c0_g1_i2.p1 TRINITY_DN5854_c0_g1~~TRINITY_DN5854_c0_g1_i2.p1  ORF type:complete len:125 (-),score=18.91 TRINITY_DN5854_c0_g1_i2:101-475(-)